MPILRYSTKLHFLHKLIFLQSFIINFLRILFKRGLLIQIFSRVSLFIFPKLISLFASEQHKLTVPSYLIIISLNGRKHIPSNGSDK